MVSAYLVAISRIIADVVNTINDHRGHPTDRPRGPSSSHWVMFLNPYFFPLSYSHITFYAILGTCCSINWRNLRWSFWFFFSMPSFIYHFFSSQPLAIRAKGMSLAVVSNWLKDFDIGHATTTGIDGIKPANLGVEVFFNWGLNLPERIVA